MTLIICPAATVSDNMIDGMAVTEQVGANLNDAHVNELAAIKTPVSAAFESWQ